MHDWVEGQLNLQVLVRQLYDSMLQRDVEAATEICHQIVVEARMVRAHINERDQ